MSTPPKHDDLCKRRKHDHNDVYFNTCVCPCEDVEPEPQSEYDVAGEWVTGEVDTSIFDRAAGSSRDTLERDIHSYRRNELANRQPVFSSSDSSPENFKALASCSSADHVYYKYPPRSPSPDVIMISDTEEEPVASGSRKGLKRIKIIEIPKSTGMPISEAAEWQPSGVEAEVAEAQGACPEATEAQAASVEFPETLGAEVEIIEATSACADHQALVVAIPVDQMEKSE